jgi:hypothetical protein
MQTQDERHFVDVNSYLVSLKDGMYVHSQICYRGSGSFDIPTYAYDVSRRIILPVGSKPVKSINFVDIPTGTYRILGNGVWLGTLRDGGLTFNKFDNATIEHHWVDGDDVHGGGLRMDGFDVFAISMDNDVLEMFSSCDRSAVICFSDGTEMQYLLPKREDTTGLLLEGAVDGIIAEFEPGVQRIYLSIDGHRLPEMQVTPGCGDIAIYFDENFPSFSRIDDFVVTSIGGPVACKIRAFSNLEKSV